MSTQPPCIPPAGGPTSAGGALEPTPETEISRIWRDDRPTPGPIHMIGADDGWRRWNCVPGEAHYGHYGWVPQVRDDNPDVMDVYRKAEADFIAHLAEKPRARWA